MSLAETSRTFLDSVEAWLQDLPEKPLAEVAAEEGGAHRLAIISVDLIEGFARQGPLASPRVDALAEPVVDLLEKADALGVRHAVLMQDSHPADAVEFQSYPPHCVAGTAEAETMEELRHFFQEAQNVKVKVISKNSISSDTEAFRDWEEEVRGEGVSAFIIVGDCTDLCIHNAAMPLKLRANQENRKLRVIIPEQCVQTYDAPFHHGDLMHAIFLYNMHQNGVEVVKRLT